MKEKTVVIYHRSDFDGIFCYQIAKKFLGTENVTYIGWDYSDPTPGKDIIDGTELLYIMDLSVPDLMDHPKLVWIDHHQTAIEKYRLGQKDSWRVTGRIAYSIDGVAACRLAWQFFTNFFLNRQTDILKFPWKEDYVSRKVAEPLAVRLAGEYDIWDKRDPDAELLQHGLRSRELTDSDWNLLLQVDGGSIGVSHILVQRLLENGKAIRYVQRQSDKAAIESCGHTLRWETLNFLCINAGARGFNSFLFEAGLKPEHDACLGWRMIAPGKYSVSLYHAPGKEHHDLSVIAKKYGGGGHKGACGFTTEKLPLGFM